MEREATLVESLSKVCSSGLPFASLKPSLRTDESVVVQDVLQMMQGFSSTWFYWDGMGQKFCVNKGMHVSHLSQSSLSCVLYRFMHAATCLRRIEAFVKQVEACSCNGLPNSQTEPSPTLQAFANAVSARLKCLREFSIEKELECSGTAAGTTVTLLSMVDSLSRVCAGAEFLLQVVIGVIPHCQLKNEMAAGELATHILDHLYEKLNEFCLVEDGEEEPYHTLLLLFICSLRPLTESLDSWLHEGTLSDPFGELFFYANNAIAVADSAFWEKGYFLRQQGTAMNDPSLNATTCASVKDEKRGADKYLSLGSSRDKQSPKLKNGNQGNNEQVPICPIFIQPIAKAIVSAGKSLQLLRHVQRDHVEAYEKNSLGNHEKSLSSSTRLPIFPQLLHRKVAADIGPQQHALICNKMSDVEQSVSDKSDRKLSLFENFSMNLLRLLGYGFSISEDYSFGLEPLTFSGQVLGSLTSKKDSLVRSEDEQCKLSRQKENRCYFPFDITAEKFQKLNMGMNGDILKCCKQGLSLLPVVKNVNELSEFPHKNRLDDPLQSLDINWSESNILVRPNKADFSMSARELNQLNEFWNIELNLSKCFLLPSLNDDSLREAIYNEDYRKKDKDSELGEDGTYDSYDMDDISLTQMNFSGCGESIPDPSSISFTGTNYAHGFGFGKPVIHHMKADSKALQMLYPYPTLLPRLQEKFHVSELLPFQQNSRLASRVLDWLQHVKLKATPQPTVLVQECLITFLKKQVDCVGQQILSKLMDEWRLMDEFAVLRAIYLFGSGDLLQQFCTVLFNKLDRGEPWDDLYELNTMLQDSIRSSADGMLLPSLDSLVVTIIPMLMEQGFGTAALQYKGRTTGFDIDILDSLQLTYKVTWPLELIADENAINKYNQVMAFLLKVKRAKFVLDKTRTWMWKSGSNDTHSNKQHLLLQQKLLHFVNTFHQYVMDRVLYSAWIELCEGMASAGSLDEVIACHEAYLVSIQRQCFIAPDKLWALIASRVRTILSLALDFYSIQNTLYNGGAAAGIKARCQMEVDRVGQQFDECILFLLRVLSFKLNVGKFPHLEDLVGRINYNYFYMSEGGHVSAIQPETNCSKGSQPPKTHLYNKN
ncbi:uncharacterized protein LOC131071418 [Cryptomeria japonica]|uniref:uncharacterized protein LOC131071418 n=1 Tax=Cryptomeria japonica TaxID=3369 RepID=UPI0027DA4665|nr:uncharacterized protein LOC131071418 [Cryptomeria japonica]XP_059063294.1 uncharacterized protein LOC131071418 [Cryptomeria japonica]